MITLGIDAHKRTHTVVAVDELGRRLGCRTTCGTTTADHQALIVWAGRFGAERTWAVEDCRHLSRRLERDMLAAGERIVRVPSKPRAQRPRRGGGWATTTNSPRPHWEHAQLS